MNPCFVVSLVGKTPQNYRLIFKKGNHSPIETKNEKEKLCKITGKSVVSKGKTQLNLHDGRNILANGEFKTGDTVKISLPDQKLTETLKLEKGATCYVSHGKHSGEIATLDKIIEREGSKAADVELSYQKEKIITRKDYLFVVDKNFKA